MFQVGDLIIGNEYNHYSFTNNKNLCMVISTRDRSSDNIEVKIVAVSNARYSDYLGKTWDVDDYRFNAISVDDYITMMQALDNDYKFIDGFEETTEEPTPVEFHEEKEYDTTPVSDDIKRRIAQQYFDLLNRLDYVGVDYDHCAEIVEEAINQKMPIISWLRQSEFWDENNLRIVVPATFHRDFDKNAIDNFHCYVIDRIDKEIESRSLRINDMTYRVYENKLTSLNNILDKMDSISYYVDYVDDILHDNTILVGGMTQSELYSVRDSYVRLKDEFVNNDRGYEYNSNYGEFLEKDFMCKIHVLRSYIQSIYDNPTQFVSQTWVDKINDVYHLDAVEGTKHTRLILKMAKQLNITTGDQYEYRDRESGEIRMRERWEQEYDKFCSAVNPRDFKQSMYVSVNIMDFLTMSWGNSWTSCYNTDKYHVLDITGQYVDGCCSGGTMSYALDPSSIVTYTLKDDSACEDYEHARKINRCVFMITPGQITQSRMYPQTEDGDAFKYKQFRENLQEVLANCWGITNQWKTEKGSSVCMETCDDDDFVGYLDLIHFEYGSVSRHKNDDETVQRFKKIQIGAHPICPSCGNSHDYEKAIQCDNCFNNGSHRCYSCDERYDEDYMHRIDGRWYCESCCFYCAGHGEWEEGDEDEQYYVDSMNGYVCDYYYDNYIHICSNCDSEFDEDDNECIETEDGTYFCCAECAEADGYHERFDLGEYYPEDQMSYCESCENWVLNEEFNSERGMCNECVANAGEEEA